MISVSRPVRFFKSLPIFLALYLAIACQAPSANGVTNDQAGEQLRTELSNLQSRIQRWYDQTLEDALPLTDDESVKSFLKKWVGKIKAQYKSAFASKDPREALYKSWVLSAQIDNYLNHSEESQSIFGAAQTEMQKMARGVVFVNEDLAHSYFSKTSADQIEKAVKDFVKKNPLKIRKNRSGVFTMIDDTWSDLMDFGGGALKTVTDIPLMPSRSLGSEGLNSVSASIDDFKGTIGELPAEIRVQIEKLLTELTDRQTSVALLLEDVNRSMDRMNEVLKGSNQLADNVDEALKTSEKPLDLTREISKSVESTAAESRKLVAEVSVLLKEMQKDNKGAGGTAKGASDHPFDIREYTSAALAIDQGATRVNDLMVVIKDLTKKEDNSPPDDHPFDIREYEATAQAIGTASGEIKSILGELRAILESDDLTSNTEPLAKVIDQSVDSASMRAEKLIDHISRRLIQIALLVFGLAVILMALWFYLRSRSRGAL